MVKLMARTKWESDVYQDNVLMLELLDNGTSCYRVINSKGETTAQSYVPVDRGQCLTLISWRFWPASRVARRPLWFIVSTWRTITLDCAKSTKRTHIQFSK